MATATRRVGRSAVAIAVVVGLLMAIVVTLGSQPDADAGASHELRDLLATADQGHYAASYAVTLETLPGALVELHLFRDGENRRTDAVIDAAGKITRIAVMSTAASRQRCTWETDGEWQCDDTATSVAEPEAILAGFLEIQQLPTLDVRDEEVAGAAARCFTGGAGEARSELCLDEAGVVLRGTVAGGMLERMSHRSDFPAAVFDVPEEMGL